MGGEEDTKLEESPKELLKEYLNELYDEYYIWYDKRAERNKKKWSILQSIVIYSGIITTVLAALQTSEVNIIKDSILYVQALLILFSLIGTAFSTILLKTKAFELFHLREKGRERMQYLIDEGKRRYSISKTDDEITEVHKWLILEVSKVEQEQIGEFFSTAAD